MYLFYDSLSLCSSSLFISLTVSIYLLDKGHLDEVSQQMDVREGR